MNAPRKITTEDVIRGRSAVEQELREAQEEHDRAAYAAAMDPGSADLRQTLADVRRKIGTLQSELEGLAAVGRVAKQVEAQEAFDADMQRRAGLFADAMADCDGLDDAIRKADALMVDLAKVRATIIGRADEARRHLLTAVQGKGRMPEVLPLVHGSVNAVWSQMLQERGVVDYETFGLSGSYVKDSAGQLLYVLDKMRTQIRTSRDMVMGVDQEAA